MGYAKEVAPGQFVNCWNPEEATHEWVGPPLMFRRIGGKPEDPSVVISSVDFDPGPEPSPPFPL